MFDFGWTELLVIAVVAIVVVGPRELPGMLRNFGKFASQLRSMASDFQRQFNDALKEAELDDVKKSIEDVRKINPVNQLKDSLNPLKEAGESVRKAVETDPQKSLNTSTTSESPKAPAADDDKTADKPVPTEAEAKAEAARKAPAKTSAAKKPPAKKTAAKKPAAKTATTKKTPARKPAAKTAAKSTSAKSAASKSTTARKPATKSKSAPKTAAATAKKPAAKPAAKPVAEPAAKSDTAA